MVESTLTPFIPEDRTRTWGNHTFELVCAIHPQTDEVGKIREFMPQARYQNRKGYSLSLYGHGPYCKFSIPENMRDAGVYVLTVDGKPVYIGECINLSSRFNIGYGNISPRNCYEGGQLTNCRVNNSVYSIAKAGYQIELWFLRAPNSKSIEAKLIEALQPEWNRKGILSR